MFLTSLDCPRRRLAMRLNSRPLIDGHRCQMRGPPLKVTSIVFSLPSPTRDWSSSSPRRKTETKAPTAGRSPEEGTGHHGQLARKAYVGAWPQHRAHTNPLGSRAELNRSGAADTAVVNSSP
jgi:hypothetical protein